MLLDISLNANATFPPQNDENNPLNDSSVSLSRTESSDFFNSFLHRELEKLLECKQGGGGGAGYDAATYELLTDMLSLACTLESMVTEEAKLNSSSSSSTSSSIILGTAGASFSFDWNCGLACVSLLINMIKHVVKNKGAVFDGENGE